MSDHLPEAALALLPQANKAAPNEPMTLVILADIANYPGDFQDACKLTIYGVEGSVCSGGFTHTANGGAFVTVYGLGAFPD
ncbi:MAG TPA: hypothetical protein VLS47_01080 [Gallionella sp.]|nr:hypothetical protein [Gallionella sp.]